MSSAEPVNMDALRKPMLTFGVELEFIVVWLYEGDKDPDGHLKELAPWGIYDDPSVLEIRSPEDIGGYYTSGVEIRSPVATDDLQAYEVLNYARNLLISNFRTYVNPTCGLHVHVGQGAERFSSDRMRRIGALLFSTEHLLVKLDHPFRFVNYYCRPLWFSRLALLARGVYVAAPPHDEADNDMQCLGYLSADVRHGEEPTSWRIQNTSEDIVEAFQKSRRDGGYEPFQVPDDHLNPSGGSSHNVEEQALNVGDEVGARLTEYLEKERLKGSKETKATELVGPSRDRFIKRIRNSWPTVEKLKEYELRVMRYTTVEADIPEHFGQTPEPGIFDCIRHIFNTTTSCEVAHLLGGEDRKRVNLQAYSCSHFAESNKRYTIEFRGAGGDLSPWVVTWAKICVGLIRFAISAPVENFLDVLISCDRSKEEEGIYDVIDLLDDLGLPAEALIAEQRIERNEHDPDFNIEYFNPESQESLKGEPKA
ncbi:hypothetical protein Hte_001282 [Hypoxylon texense]